MTPAGLKSISKFCSLMLRHSPDTFGLSPDADGFVPLAELLGVMKGHPRFAAVTEADVRQVVASSEKQRFEIRDGTAAQIRARYGHTYQTLSYEPTVPPATLLHGTPTAVLDAIRANGLLPMSRKYVHMTSDADVALAVARRKGASVVVLTIRSGAAHQAGVVFFQPAPTIFLAERIDPQWIEFPK